MGSRPRATQSKREKEKKRQQKQMEKAARRLEAKERKGSASERPEGEDPDLAGIVPGPQALPEEWRTLIESKEAENAPADDDEEGGDQKKQED
jgi:hypothetical protein